MTQPQIEPMTFKSEGGRSGQGLQDPPSLSPIITTTTLRAGHVVEKIGWMNVEKRRRKK